MTKQYPIIKLGEHLYAVDKSYNYPKNGDFFYRGYYFHTGGQYIRDIVKITKESREARYASSSLEWFKIIATTNNTLGLPLLPSIEEDIDSIFDLVSKSNLFENDLIYNIGNKKDSYYIAKRIFIEGYKAASRKKYAEDDVREAFKTGAKAGLGKNVSFKDFLESLEIMPVAVEIEMESWKIDGSRKAMQGDDPTDLYLWKPKVKDGFVLVKNWIYE